MVVVGVNETKLEVNGGGGDNTLESEAHFEFGPLVHIHLSVTLGNPRFKIPFGQLWPGQHGCALWQVTRIGHVGEQGSRLVDQRKLHAPIWATTRCVPITVQTDCGIYLHTREGGYAFGYKPLIVIQKLGS